MNIACMTLRVLFFCLCAIPISSFADTPPKPTKFEKSGETKFNSGDYSGAIKDYTKAINADPKNSYLHYYRGLAKIFLKDYSGTIKDTSKAIELDSKNGAALYLRGTARKETGKDKEAIADFTEALKLSLGDYSMQLNLYSARGAARSNLKDYYGAVADYDEAIKLKSDKGLSYFLRGAAKLHLGEKEAALKDFSKAGDLGYSEAYDIIKKIREN